MIITNSGFAISGLLMLFLDKQFKDFSTLNDDTRDISNLIKTMIYMRILLNLLFCLCQSIYLLVMNYFPVQHVFN